MCESNVYLKKDDSEELIMEDVSQVTPLPGGKVLVENILGEQKELEASIETINLMEHKIILK